MQIAESQIERERPVAKLVIKQYERGRPVEGLMIEK